MVLLRSSLGYLLVTVLVQAAFWYRGTFAHKHESKKPTPALRPAYCAFIAKSKLLSHFAAKLCKVIPPPARYLPTLHPAKWNRDKDGFSKWFSTFKEEQQKWCGMPSTPIQFTPKKKVFENVALNSWPWMVSLYQLPSYMTRLLDLHNDGERILQDMFGHAVSVHRCGGALISSQFVLTAAHCVRYLRFPGNFTYLAEKINYLRRQVVERCIEREVTKMPEREAFEKCVDPLIAVEKEISPMIGGVPGNGTDFWEIWVGAHLSPPQVPAEHVMNLKVKSIRHYTGSEDIDDLSKKAFHEDLALVQLEKPISSFSDAIKPICLTPKYSRSYLSKDVKNCAVAGWGAQFDENGKMDPVSEQLQDAPYNILSDKDCKHKTKGYDIVKNATSVKHVNKKKVLCGIEQDYRRTKTPGIKTKLCYGDSGGPLICKYKDGRWYHIGIMSYGKSSSTDEKSTCELKNSPDVFTKVPSFVNWILKTMYELSSQKGVVSAPPGRLFIG